MSVISSLDRSKALSQFLSSPDHAFFRSCILQLSDPLNGHLRVSRGRDVIILPKFTQVQFTASPPDNISATYTQCPVIIVKIGSGISKKDTRHTFNYRQTEKNIFFYKVLNVNFFFICL